MIYDRTLTRSEQFALNSRAIWRDLVCGQLDKLRFHLRGCWRAIAGD